MKKFAFFVLLICFNYISQAQTVYKTPSGAKYHTAQCRTVKNVSEKISLTKAADLGLTACKVCKPAIVTTYKAAIKKPAGQNSTVQCKGKTKKGARCQHMTKIGNGYCFQHQPG